jgi:leucyl-tRNA synthetase
MPKKFFIVFAWPTMSGSLHVGHARSYTIPDIIARYKRQTGEDVFFPIGFHATGIDCITIFNKIKEDPSQSKFYGLSEDEVSSINSPVELEKTFEEKSISTFKNANLTLDYDARTSTIDPNYKKFIEWQFKKLKDLGYLVQDSYRLPWCPNDNNPVSLDDAEADVKASKGAKIETLNIAELSSNEGYSLLGYTTDNESINKLDHIEVNPEVDYCICKIDEKVAVVAKSSIKKLIALGKKIEVNRDLKGRDLIGKKVNLGGREFVIQSSDIDPDYGTVIKLVFDKSDSHAGSITGPKKGELADTSTDDIIYKDKMYELSVKPIYCRCGAEIEVRAVKNQWFIDYSNAEWKKLDKKLIDKLKTSPPEFKEELYSIIDWLDKRPCARKVGFGTEFPFDKSWIIEALSDSTIYMAFYPLVKWIKKLGLGPDNLKPEFFDYVLLGKGDKDFASKTCGITPAVLDDIQSDFKGYYPLDVNFGGVEHKKAHFPLFIANHAAIFPEELWPKSIALNWHVIAEGQKMSKHLGNVVFWNDAIKEFGVDSVRLYIAHGASQWSQFNWSNASAATYKEHIKTFENSVDRRINSLEGSLDKKTPVVDSWAYSKINSFIREVTANMDSYQVRNAVNIAFFDFNNTLDLYTTFGGANSNLVKEATAVQLMLLKPFIPETSERLMKKVGLRELENWPKPDLTKINRKLEVIFDSVIKTISDINDIQKLNEKKGKCTIYVATEEELRVYNELKDFVGHQTGLLNIEVKVSSDKINLDIDGVKRVKTPVFLRPAIVLEDVEAKKR